MKYQKITHLKNPGKKTIITRRTHFSTLFKSKYSKSHKCMIKYVPNFLNAECNIKFRFSCVKCCRPIIFFPVNPFLGDECVQTVDYKKKMFSAQERSQLERNLHGEICGALGRFLLTTSPSKWDGNIYLPMVQSRLMMCRQPETSK